MMQPAKLFLRFESGMMLLVVFLLSASQLRAQGMGEVGLPLGSDAVGAAVEDLEGNPVELASFFEGKPTLLEFWATWCENCAALQPEMDRLWAKYQGRVNVVAVAVAIAQTPRRVRRHLENEHNPGYPFVWDVTGAAVRAYHAPTTSFVVVLDASGTVVYTGVGPDQELVAALDALLES